ncbi:MAG: DUF4830 domain-containing protein [Candidatus Limnocylindria bacterium]
MLVDRAEVIASARVTKAERTYSGYKDRVGARRLTLRTLDTLKGTAPPEFVVDDGPCPMLVATEGESFVALLTATSGIGTGLKPIGLPVSALRATPTRTLAQLASDIRAISPLDGDARALFAEYGWTVTSAEGSGEFDLPPLAQFSIAGREIRGAVPAIMGSLDRYAAVSDDVGLDMRTAAGQHVERLSFWLDRKPPEYAEATRFGHVLISERRIVAAWITVIPQGGPFSVRDRTGVLASSGAPASFPPINRFPSGVNVAKAYDLARATSVAYKTGAGQNGSITDASRVRALANALDMALPTTQAIWDRNGTSTTYYLHFDFGASSVSLQYEASDGTLTVLADGYSVRPGPAFASLISAIR